MCPPIHSSEDTGSRPRSHSHMAWMVHYPRIYIHSFLAASHLDHLPLLLHLPGRKLQRKTSALYVGKNCLLKSQMEALPTVRLILKAVFRHTCTALRRPQLQRALRDPVGLSRQLVRAVKYQVTIRIELGHDV